MAFTSSTYPRAGACLRGILGDEDVAITSRGVGSDEGISTCDTNQQDQIISNTGRRTLVEHHGGISRTRGIAVISEGHSAVGSHVGIQVADNISQVSGVDHQSTTQGGNYWTLITPEIWKVLHAVSERKPLFYMNRSSKTCTTKEKVA